MSILISTKRSCLTYAIRTNANRELILSCGRAGRLLGGPSVSAKIFRLRRKRRLMLTISIAW